MKGSHISLFAGVGMTDIAAEQAGFKTVATAESDKFNRSVLERRFPRAVHYRDVRDVSPWPFYDQYDYCHNDPPERPLLISGGFPCQDIAPSGPGHGLEGDRSGLWSEFRRIIYEFQPEYVLIENSALLRSRGLHVVLRDLHNLGYDARWDCVTAQSVGAPHLRDRIFIAAMRRGTGTVFAPGGGKIVRTIGMLNLAGGIHTGEFVGPNKYATKLPRAGGLVGDTVYECEPQHPRKRASYPTPTRSDGSGGPGTTPKREGGKNLRTVVNELDGNGRLNPEWVEWMMGLPGGWTDPTLDNSQLCPHPGWSTIHGIERTVPHGLKDRAKRIRALGNGLVPQAASVALGWLNLN